MRRPTRDVRKDILFAAAFSLVLAVGALFRFMNLSSAPLWMDEAFTVLAARLLPSEIAFNEVDNHPPLVYLIQSFWSNNFPDLSLTRVPAAFAGTLTVLVIIFANWNLWSRTTAIWAGAVLAVSTGHIYYSQDARLYPFLVLGLATSTWGLLGLSDSERHMRTVYSILYLSGALFAIYSHFVALPYLACVNLAVTIALLRGHGSSRNLPVIVSVNILVVTLSVPWFLHIYRTVGSFPGLGLEQPDLRTVLFFVRNAVGFAGLPRIFDYAAFAVFVGAAIAGGVTAWRAGRECYSVVLLAALVIYPLLLVALNFKTPILAARVFLPMIVPAVLLCSVWLGRQKGLGWIVGIFLVLSGTVASVSEHYGRTKYDNPSAALKALAERELQNIPIVTCNFFDASSILIAAEQTGVVDPRIFLVSGVDIMKFDEGHFRAVNMSMARLRTASASEVDSFLGATYTVEGGLREIAVSEDSMAVVGANCDDSFLDRVTSEMKALGFDLIERRFFRKEGRVVMERGNTQLLLFRRSDR